MRIGSKKWRDVIYDGAKDLEIQIGRENIDQFATHALELMKWTTKTNLTSITDPLEIAVKHFLDSISRSEASGGITGAGAMESRKCLTAISRGSVMLVRLVFVVHFISSRAWVAN